MARVLLLYVLPFALPSLVYLAWMWWRARRGLAPLDAKTPWVWLAAAGVALTALVAFLYDDAHRAAPGGLYEPPRLEGGKVVPGRTTPGSP